MSAHGSQQFGPVFEVHRVEVSPLAAPYEAVLLEDVDDRKRDAVAIRATSTPKPIVGGRRIDIDPGPPCMHAAVAGGLAAPAVERAGARKGEFLHIRSERIECFGHGTQAIRNAVDAGDLHRTAA